MIKFFLITMIGMILSGCIPVYHSKVSDTQPLVGKEKVYIVNANYDQTWNTILRNLVLQEWKIIASSKDGGIITTDVVRSSNIRPIFPVGNYEVRNQYVDGKIHPHYKNGYIAHKYKRGNHVEVEDPDYIPSSGEPPICSRQANYNSEGCLLSKDTNIRWSFVIQKINQNKTSVKVAHVLKAYARENALRGNFCKVLDYETFIFTSPDGYRYGGDMYMNVLSCGRSSALSESNRFLEGLPYN